jgi:hypothetical protein
VGAPGIGQGTPVPAPVRTGVPIPSPHENSAMPSGVQSSPSATATVTPAAGNSSSATP